MYTPNSHTQLTFYYTDGQTESFNIYEPADEAVETRQEVRLEVRRLLEQHWWVLNLPEQTVLINTANVLKVEVKPPMPLFHGDGFFAHAERVTALNRSH